MVKINEFNNEESDINNLNIINNIKIINKDVVDLKKVTGNLETEIDKLKNKTDKIEIKIENIEKNQSEILINQVKFESKFEEKLNQVTGLIKENSDQNREYERKIFDHMLNLSTENNKAKNVNRQEWVKFAVKALIIGITTTLSIITTIIVTSGK